MSSNAVANHMELVRFLLVVFLHRARFYIQLKKMFVYFLESFLNGCLPLTYLGCGFGVLLQEHTLGLGDVTEAH